MKPAVAAVLTALLVAGCSGDDDPRVQTAEVGRATVAAELAILLLAWPEFARFNTAEAIDRVHHRVEVLVEAWVRTAGDRPDA